MTVYSQRIANLQPSPIREILSIANRPGVVSFAGGLPASETFITPDVSTMPVDLLQYGPSEGELELRTLVSEKLLHSGLKFPPERILILSGSQQGIDLTAKLLVDPGTRVLVESPTYLAALQVLNFYGARLSSFDINKLTKGAWRETTPSFLYTIPTFRNPTGECYSLEQRKSLAKFCDEHSIVLFEDDPYRDLVYESCERTPVCSFLRSASWIYQGSFSKNLAPGLRLGFLACSKDLITYMIRLKQAADLHSNRLSQWLVTQQLQSPDHYRRMDNLAQYYRAKRDQFSDLLQKYFSELASWNIPTGGLFFWLKLNQAVPCGTLVRNAIENNVAFLSGDLFFHEPLVGQSYIRLNFSHAPAKDADRGLRILANCVEQIM